MRIERKIANSKYVLFSDSEHFHKEITGVKNLSDIKDWFQIKGRLVKIYESGNEIGYRLQGTSYKFALTLVH